MAHWIAHLYGPRNLYRDCAKCGEETNVEELEVNKGICRECMENNRQSEKDKTKNETEKKG